MKSPVTMKDLADALGLSVSSVARALADSPRIGKATIERVKAEALRRGYVVDQAARAMRQGTSSLVGFIAPDLQNDFYSTAARAISDAHAGTGSRHARRAAMPPRRSPPRSTGSAPIRLMMRRSTD